MLALRRAGGVPKAGLHEKDERLLRMLSLSYRLFRTSDLLESSTQMHGSGAPACRRSPGNRGAQRVIDFKSAGAVGELLELLFVSGAEFFRRHREQLAGRDIAEDQVIWRQILQALDPSGRLYCAT